MTAIISPWRQPVQHIPDQAGATEGARVPDAWAWLEPDAVFGAMRQDWLDTSDQAFRLRQGLVDELWQSIWATWYPVASDQTFSESSDSA